MVHKSIYSNFRVLLETLKVYLGGLILSCLICIYILQKHFNASINDILYDLNFFVNIQYLKKNKTNIENKYY